jgi:AcrR family transcriptional regulator
MQRPDEKKRQQIMRAATRLFAMRPFHKVKLDEIAAAASVGKGTLYIYFKSKDDLYYALVYEGFALMVDRLQADVGERELPPREALRQVCKELVGFGFSNPQFFEMIRQTGGMMRHTRWESKRRELTSLIEHTIRRGVAAGEFDDRHPEITAVFLPGLMRSIMLYTAKSELREPLVTDQIMRWVERGVGAVEINSRTIAPQRGTKAGKAHGKRSSTGNKATRARRTATTVGRKQR